MGRNNEIKYMIMLTGLISALSITAKASEYDAQIDVNSLRSLESLEPEQRVEVRQRIGDFLRQNPNINVSKYRFGVDNNGVIYVLDAAKVPFNRHDVLAQPSCIESH